MIAQAEADKSALALRYPLICIPSQVADILVSARSFPARPYDDFSRTPTELMAAAAAQAPIGLTPRTKTPVRHNLRTADARYAFLRFGDPRCSFMLLRFAQRNKNRYRIRKQVGVPNYEMFVPSQLQAQPVQPAGSR